MTTGGPVRHELRTWDDVDKLVEDFDYKPRTTVEQGIKKFVEWYRGYYGV